MGFEAKIGLEEGLLRTVEWFRQSVTEGEISTERAESSFGRI
jgi:hypothetical protein